MGSWDDYKNSYQITPDGRGFFRIGSTDLYTNTYREAVTLSNMLGIPVSGTPITAPGTMNPPSLVVDSSSQITTTLASAPTGTQPFIYDIRYSTDQTNWTQVSDIVSPYAIVGLDPETEYFVETRARNSAGAGDWSLPATATTDTLDLTAPTVVSLSPLDDATDVAQNTTLAITFSEAMAQQGNLIIKNVGGSNIETFDASTDGTWSSGDTVFTVTPSSALPNNSDIAVQWNGFEDVAGNALPDNATENLWNFATISVAPSLSIQVERDPVPEAQVAPEGVRFKANPENWGPFKTWTVAPHQTYDPITSELFIEWDFGDNRDPWTAPDIVAEHNVPSKAYGRQVGHVYTTPGTYTVTCTVYKTTGFAPLEVFSMTETYEITIGDPATVWDETNTCVVAFDGDFTGAPASNYQVTTPTELRNVTDNTFNNAGGIARYLFKRGEDYIVNDPDMKIALSRTVGRSAWLDLTYLSDWGDPADEMPIVPRIPDGELRDTSIKAENLWVKCDYNPETDLFDRNGGVATVSSTDWQADAGIKFEGWGWRLALGCKSSNGNSGLAIGSNDRPSDGAGGWKTLKCFFDNCISIEHLNYGGYFNDEPRDFFSVRGCKIEKAHRLYTSPVNRSKFHGAFRCVNNGIYHMDGCSLFARGGWGSGSPWVDGAGTSNPQPVYRINGNPSRSSAYLDHNMDPFLLENVGFSHISRCMMEGPSTTITGTTTGNGPQSMAGVLMENNVCVIGPRGSQAAKLLFGNATFRGNLIIKCDTQEEGMSEVALVYAEEVTLVDPNGVPPPYEVPYDLLGSRPGQIYSNTVVVLYDEATMDRSDRGNFYDFPLYTTFPFDPEGGNGPDAASGPIENLEISNNVVYTPNFAVKHPDHVEYSATTDVIYTPKYIGRRLYGAPDNQVVQSQFATPADTVAWYGPTDPAELPTATAGAISLFSVTGDVLVDGTANVPQGAHFYQPPGSYVGWSFDGATVNTIPSADAITFDGTNVDQIRT